MEKYWRGLSPPLSGLGGRVPRVPPCGAAPADSSSSAGMPDSTDLDRILETIDSAKWCSLVTSISSSKFRCSQRFGDTPVHIRKHPYTPVCIRTHSYASVHMLVTPVFLPAYQRYWRVETSYQYMVSQSYLNINLLITCLIICLIFNLSSWPVCSSIWWWTFLASCLRTSDFLPKNRQECGLSVGHPSSHHSLSPSPCSCPQVHYSAPLTITKSPSSLLSPTLSSVPLLSPPTITYPPSSLLPAHSSVPPWQPGRRLHSAWGGGRWPPRRGAMASPLPSPSPASGSGHSRSPGRERGERGREARPPAGHGNRTVAGGWESATGSQTRMELGRCLGGSRMNELIMENCTYLLCTFLGALRCHSLMIRLWLLVQALFLFLRMWYFADNSGGKVRLWSLFLPVLCTSRQVTMSITHIVYYLKGVMHIHRDACLHRIGMKTQM